MNAILVTGSNGGIGTAICTLLKEKGYFIIGTDIGIDKNRLDHFIQFDLRLLVTDKNKRIEFSCLFEAAVSRHNLKALINNAAVQILSGMDNIQIEDFKETIDTNLTAPFVLSKLTYSHLKKARGSIVNIGSIHSKLTKPEFISYATSKSALLGLTQAMAVDIGQHIRVNIIQPAATATAMLIAGFKDNPKGLSKLESYHPTNSIASTSEISEAVFFLVDNKCLFLNGTSLDIDGGISARLHDPS